MRRRCGCLLVVAPSELLVLDPGAVEQAVAQAVKQGLRSGRSPGERRGEDGSGGLAEFCLGEIGRLG